MEIKLSSSELIRQSKPSTQLELSKDNLIEKKAIEVKVSTSTSFETNEPLKEEDVKKAVVDFNKFLGNSNTHLQYEYHEELKEHFVKLVNNTTNEVVKEIPSKKILDIHAAMREYLGFFVDKKI